MDFGRLADAKDGGRRELSERPARKIESLPNTVKATGEGAMICDDSYQR
jgi:hypothetical protein